MSELTPINIVLGDRTYRIKITPHNEEAVRKTIKSVNDKIVEFKTQFSGKDMQDYIAMALIWIATNQPADNTELSDDLAQRLAAIEDAITKVLGEHS